MSTEVQVPSGQPEVIPSGNEQEIKPSQSPSGIEEKKTVETNETVKRETLLKSVAQEKNARARAEAAEQKAQELERKLMELEGNKDELIKSLKEENEQIKTEAKMAKAKEADAKIKSQIIAKAQQLGAHKPEIIADKFIDFSTLDVDSAFTVGDDSLTLALDKLKRENAFLFNTNKPSVVDGSPVTSSTQIGDVPKKSYSEMSRDDAKAAFINDLLGS